MSKIIGSKRMRSRERFDNPGSCGMTVPYLHHYLNYGLTHREAQSEKPIIDMTQIVSVLSPSSGHHIELALGVREYDGIVAAKNVYAPRNFGFNARFCSEV